jgi:hypothetical protein
MRGHSKWAEQVIVTGALLFLVSSCSSMRAFTTDDKQQYEPELQDLQFYLSEDAVLSRRVESSDAKVARDHKIRTFHGRQVEEIFIGRSTPGILIDFDGNGLLMSFEPPAAGVERTLHFIPEPDGLYYLEVLQDSTQRTRDLVEYSGLKYRLGTYGQREGGDLGPRESIRSADTFRAQARPFLKVESKNIDELERRRRELPGRELP